MAAFRMKSSNGLILWLSVMAFLSTLTSAGILSEVLGRVWSTFVVAVVAALQAGTAVYIRLAQPVESMPPSGRGLG